MQYFHCNFHKENVQFLCTVTNNTQFLKICYSKLIFKTHVYGRVGCGVVYFHKLIDIFRRDLLPPSSGYSEIRGFIFPLKICSNLVHRTSILPKIIIFLLETVRVTDFTVNFSLTGRICYTYIHTYIYIYIQTYLLCVFRFCYGTWNLNTSITKIRHCVASWDLSVHFTTHFFRILGWEAKNILIGLPLTGKVWLLANFSNSKLGKLTRASLLPARVYSYSLWPGNPSSCVGHTVERKSDEYLIFPLSRICALAHKLSRWGKTPTIINGELVRNDQQHFFICIVLGPRFILWYFCMLKFIHVCLTFDFT